MEAFVKAILIGFKTENAVFRKGEWVKMKQECS